MKKFEDLNEKEVDEENKTKENSNIHTDIELFKSKKIKAMPQAKAKGAQPIGINDPLGKKVSSTKKASPIAERPVNEEKKIKQERVDDEELKCKYAAIVLDRLFFCIVSIYALITFIGLIMSIPNFYK